jgi:hypothetical protein
MGVLGIVGCTDNMGGAANSNKNALQPFRIISGMGFLSTSDTTPVHAVMFFQGGRLLDQNGVTQVDANASAVFMDATNLHQASVTSATAAGYSLSLPPSSVVYTKVNSAMYSSAPSTIAWAVSGYQGGSISDLDTLPSAINITNHSAGDTVSKSAGFSISYTGYDGGDVIAVASYDAGLTIAYLGTSATYKTGQGAYTENGSDNGSISFPSSDLSNFSTGNIIRVSVKHWEYHPTTSSNGIKVGVASLISEDIPLYLAP